MILVVDANQALGGAQVERLKVVAGRRFSATTEKTMVADLRTVLIPDYLAQARELATRMTKPADGAAFPADLVAKFADSRCVR